MVVADQDSTGRVAHLRFRRPVHPRYAKRLVQDDDARPEPVERGGEALVLLFPLEKHAAVAHRKREVWEYRLGEGTLEGAERSTMVGAEHRGVQVATRPADHLAAHQMVHALRHAEVVVEFRADERVPRHHLLGQPRHARLLAAAP